MDLVWLLPPPWDWFVIISLLTVVCVPIFWLSLTGYHRRYFFDKALKLAVLRTIGWLILYGGSFALVFWIFSLLWPPGWTRYVVGGIVWWLLSETILALAWQFIDRLLEVL